MNLIFHRSRVIAVVALAVALCLPLGALAATITPGTYNWVPEGPYQTFDVAGAGQLIVTDAAGDLGAGSYFSVSGDTFNLTAYAPHVFAQSSTEVYIGYNSGPPVSYPTAASGDMLGISGYLAPPAFPNVDQHFWDFDASLNQSYSGIGEWVLANASGPGPTVPDPCSTLALLGFSMAALRLAARRINPAVS